MPMENERIELGQETKIRSTIIRGGGKPEAGKEGGICSCFNKNLNPPRSARGEDPLFERISKKCTCFNLAETPLCLAPI